MNLEEPDPFFDDRLVQPQLREVASMRRRTIVHVINKMDFTLRG